ncbi:uncharacterized protein F4817DRAFT_368217 [Daldinia loculata]|uniref:uncharacterized protein n=1 Tax=Daldinia loculata TaxID=103429 RepID=UPI0020C31BE5|nr:uncharacterized protein F4817DRAFT_368217 [Daldinia loculata]KAI1643647.1 hypothetical protein F4817DRAFT_368217 [Daldinia loculata]
MESNLTQDASFKRKADEISLERNEEIMNTASHSEGPPPKKTKTDDDFEPWNEGMDMPLGKLRPRFVGETEDRRSGSGTVEDPELVWLGAIPDDAIAREANEDIVWKAARRLETVTHVYIRCAMQSTMYVDRDGKRIHIWNPDRIDFRYKTRRTDPHIAVAFGTTPDNLVLYGFIHVATDENGKPVDFATYRDDQHTNVTADPIVPVMQGTRFQLTLANLQCPWDVLFTIPKGSLTTSVFEHAGRPRVIVTIIALAPMTLVNQWIIIVLALTIR